MFYMQGKISGKTDAIVAMKRVIHISLMGVNQLENESSRKRDDAVEKSGKVHQLGFYAM
jgi:hypothetical protein